MPHALAASEMLPYLSTRAVTQKYSASGTVAALQTVLATSTLHLDYIGIIRVNRPDRRYSHSRQKYMQKRQIVAFASVSPALTNRKPAAERTRARPGFLIISPLVVFACVFPFSSHALRKQSQQSVQWPLQQISSHALRKQSQQPVQRPLQQI